MLPENSAHGASDSGVPVCTDVRPALDKELPSAYVEEYRCALDGEILRYVGEAYPKGVCSVYCGNGKDAEGLGSDFELVVVISAARHSPQNFCNGSWRSVWSIEFKDEVQMLELKGKLQVGAHYFEEGNVQLDAKHECKDSTIFQDLRRKLLVTRTLFPWQNTLQFILTRDITKELGIGK